MPGPVEVTLDALPASTLARLLPLGERALALTAAMAKAGRTPVSLLTGHEDVGAARHYPEGDVFDCASRAQFYYHRHRQGEYGHIHLFQRGGGRAADWEAAEACGDADALCHLVAVAFDAAGRPVEMFTTNRWVTGEMWVDAKRLKAILRGWRVTTYGSLALAADWLNALVGFYRPVIEDLIDARDASVARWSRLHPDCDPLEDPRLVITSRSIIDLPRQVASLRATARV